MKILVRIFTQYSENYSDEPETNPYWKMKGGQEFQIKVDDMTLMYDEETVVHIIKEMLKEQSNSHCKYNYISHEKVFSDPVELNSDRFNTIYMGMVEKRMAI